MYSFKKEVERGWNRKKWLAEHPEDLPLDAENQMWRQRGWDDDGIRQLYAAICLRVCIDYKNATLGKNVDGKIPEVTEGRSLSRSTVSDGLTVTRRKGATARPRHGYSERRTTVATE